MIDHVMRFNLPSASAKLAELARVVRAPGGDAGSDEARAATFVTWLAARLASGGRRARPSDR
jgi:alcohol dehydrogenase class IV